MMVAAFTACRELHSNRYAPNFRAFRYLRKRLFLNWQHRVRSIYYDSS